MREIPEEEYNRWSQIYDQAATTLTNRADELDKAAEMIEQNLFLLGATAIEDKLQDGVPDTIHTLQEAGIKVWVLTGDRQETAINIGYSCRLLNEDMSLIICNEDNHFGTKSFLEAKLHEVVEAREQHSHHDRGDNQNHHEDPMALIIDGRALTFALEKDIERVFLDLAKRCKAVICCRVSPLQKALVVKLVKKYSRSILLAIGDGANDVSMIQAAHVGVGISGVEGLQAARSADFSISQFRFLRKLLLVHGSWAYQRLSKMIFYFFYKNVALYLTQFWVSRLRHYNYVSLRDCSSYLTITPPISMLSSTAFPVRHCTSHGQCLASTLSSLFCHLWLLVFLISLPLLASSTSTLKCICWVKVTNSSTKSDFGAGLPTQFTILW